MHFTCQIFYAPVVNTLCKFFVNCYALIMSSMHYLCTISNFGAKLISLYFFLAKNGGKVLYSPCKTLLIVTYTLIRFLLFTTYSQVYPPSYPHS